MGNINRAARLIGELRAAGVREFCVCAGSRNSPLLAVLGASRELSLFSFVDERSAAFFALGRMKLHGAPVAVVTTSGTAAAELLPAAVEALYSGQPLVLITADRPARYRGTGAPQSIEQTGIFGVYAEDSLEKWSRTQALHLNIEFDEPLIDGDPQPAIHSVDLRVAAHEQRSIATAPPIHMQRPLVIVGSVPRDRRERVRAFVQRLNAPTYAEPLSGLREDATLPLITSGERMINRIEFDGVIRIGGVPTLRFWRDLEDREVPVIHFSDLPFTGLTRGELYPIEALPQAAPLASDEEVFNVDRRQADAFAAILDDEPESELSMIRTLSRELPDGSRVYLGNSLPIREWDLAATRMQRGFEYEANRGANGIDGQLSTFFGWADAQRDNVCVVGDLTTIYDLNAPWIVAQLGYRRFRVVVVNNGGGRIFSRVNSLKSLDPAVREQIIENSHDVRFQHWAAMWNIDVTELRPDPEASQRVWRRYDELWA